MSCKKNECTPAKYSYTFSEHKKIDTIRLGGYLLWAQVNPGTNIVFSYSLRGKSCPNRIDGPSAEHLTFEIPAGTANFDYSGAGIQGIECYYQYGSWEGNDAVKVTDGTLKGNRISDSEWVVDVDLTIPARGATLSFTKEFGVQ